MGRDLVASSLLRTFTSIVIMVVGVFPSLGMSVRLWYQPARGWSGIWGAGGARRLFHKVTFERKPEDASSGGDDGRGSPGGLVLGPSHDPRGLNALPRFNDEVKHIKVVEKDSWIHITEAKKFESLLVCDPVVPWPGPQGSGEGPGVPPPPDQGKRPPAPRRLQTALTEGKSPVGLLHCWGRSREMGLDGPWDSSGLVTAPTLGLLSPRGFIWVDSEGGPTRPACITAAHLPHALPPPFPAGMQVKAQAFLMRCCVFSELRALHVPRGSDSST